MLVAEALFAYKSIGLHAVIARTEQLVVMQGPDNANPLGVSCFGDYGRELGMDVAQVYYIGFEILNEPFESLFNFAGAQWTQ